MKLEFSLQIFENFSNIKFHELPSSGGPAVPWGRTDGRAGGHDEANSRFFVILRMCLKNRTLQRLFSLHCKPISRKLQSTDETIFRSLIHHTGRIRVGRSGVRFTEATRDMSLLENKHRLWVPTSLSFSGYRVLSHPQGTAAEAWGWPHISIYYRG
jgi:hypothetical protein